MLDLHRIRAEPESVKEGLRRRLLDDADERVDRILAVDRERRDTITRSDELKARRNQVSKEIGDRKREGKPADDMIEEMREVGVRIKELDQEVQERDEVIRAILLDTPNLPLEMVPVGGEEAGEIVREWGEPGSFDFDPRPHWELGEALGILDLERGARISGSGFLVLRGGGARLQRGLINWMLDIHVREHGYRELRLPYLVTTETLTGTGQLPKFADDSYQTRDDGLWLIPTAEVPVTNLHGGEILSGEELPVAYTAYSPCFRREAGAAGKDTRGMLRVHQFDKVELVRLERPERSLEALEELTAQAEAILQALDLPYRVVRLATDDLAFASAMTYDLEVWAPGVEQWLEVSSCSVCTDYQARRADLRFRPGPGAKPEHVHTLNGSALALPRLMVALLETYQEEDGSVTLPEVIRSYVGADRLEP